MFGLKNSLVAVALSLLISNALASKVAPKGAKVLTVAVLGGKKSHCGGRNFIINCVFRLWVDRLGPVSGFILLRRAA
jgi:CBS-domain-containing membrane protein